MKAKENFKRFEKEILDNINNENTRDYCRKSYFAGMLDGMDCGRTEEQQMWVVEQVSRTIRDD